MFWIVRKGTWPLFETISSSTTISYPRYKYNSERLTAEARTRKHYPGTHHDLEAYHPSDKVSVGEGLSENGTSGITSLKLDPEFETEYPCSISRFQRDIWRIELSEEVSRAPYLQGERLGPLGSKSREQP